MKKYIISSILIFSVTLSLSLTGCKSEITNSAQKEEISKGFSIEDNIEVSLDNAKQIVLKDAGVNEADTTFTKSEIDFENGHKVYDFEFYSSDAEYEYEIDVSDGSIYSKSVDKFREDIQGSSDYALDLEKAKKIALDNAGLSESEVNFIETKQDKDDGIDVYEIEFTNSGKKYEYKIRISDGSILECDID